VGPAYVLGFLTDEGDVVVVYYNLRLSGWMSV